MELALCICTCGRPEGLARTLAAVDSLAWPEGEMPSFAVVVVDNLPDGRARTVVERLRPAFRWSLHFVEEPERGVAQARNRAVAEALSLGAEFVAFVDDDDLPKPDWLWWLWKRQRETGADIVFGAWEETAPPDAGVLARALVEVRGQRRSPPDGQGLPAMAATRNILFAREILERMRATGAPVFSPAFSRCKTEDTHMFRRALQLGARVAECRESIVTVELPAAFRTWLRREYEFGYGWIRIADELGLPSDSILKSLRQSVKLALQILLWPSPRNIARRGAKLANRLGRIRARLPGDLG